MKTLFKIMFFSMLLFSCTSNSEQTEVKHNEVEFDSLIQANSKLKQEAEDLKKQQPAPLELKKNAKEEVIPRDDRYDKLNGMSELQLFQNVVTSGSSLEEVKDVLGNPGKIEKSNYGEITTFYYEFGEVIFKNGYANKFEGYHPSIISDPIALMTHPDVKVRDWFDKLLDRKDK